MRRKDREITEKDEIIEIIKKCDVCRLAFYDYEFPYIVPMNFGFSFIDNEITLYFHCANEGKKLDILKANNHVCFEMDCSHKLIEGELACNYSMEYESVIGNGMIEVLENEDKIQALTLIMKKYSNASHFEFEEKNVNAVTLLKLNVKNITAKRLKKST